jgi:hypothetical protein
MFPRLIDLVGLAVIGLEYYAVIGLEYYSRRHSSRLA